VPIPKTFEDAKRGFIAAPSGQVKDAAGNVIWDFDSYAFVKGAAPATVNPSLWRQALLNNQIGLFKVTEGIYQLRGFDLANITLIEGKTGWIVVDTLTARETATAAMAFARKHLGDKSVSAVIFTHSHVDHFGGALGVIPAEEAKARKIPVVAPAGFMDEATSENIMMGVAMARRSMFMYGSRLPRDAKGSVDTGLGKAVAYGQVGILPPTVLVDQAHQELLIDGLRFVFHNVPGSEAPSEFVFYIPEKKAFGGAEMLSHTLHNLYTLRGAKVRDALKWSNYIDESLAYAADAEVVFNQHHWPVWGKARIREFITKQRDTYKFIHDQTVRQMNAGLTAPEIAEVMTLPTSLDDYMNVHGYYGTVRHNVKAVYQHYLGWFDAHPSNLDALPPVEAGKRYVILGRRRRQGGGCGAGRLRCRRLPLGGRGVEARGLRRAQAQGSGRTAWRAVSNNWAMLPSRRRGATST
jgi:alkyl sulfatase BDS1-like metallo-beta-lactamase superfamily hydrolase